MANIAKVVGFHKTDESNVGKLPGFHPQPPKQTDKQKRELAKMDLLNING